MKTGFLPEAHHEQNNTTSQFFSEKKTGSSSFFPDHREEAAAQRKMQEAIHNSPRMVGQRKLHNAIFGKAIQKMGKPDEEMLQGKFGKPIQKMHGEEEEMMQGKFQQAIQKMGKSDEEMLQGKFQKPIQKKGNSTGMPDGVKQKMESAIGADFSDVKIHANSQSAPEVGALAYTQGNDVHFAPGQFKPDTSAGQELLGHELTHVVQQRQGIVKPTTSAGGMPVNDDPGLERAADNMGRKAAQMKLPEDEIKK